MASSAPPAFIVRREQLSRQSANQAHTARIGAPTTLDRLAMPGIIVQADQKLRVRTRVHQGTTAPRSQRRPDHARKAITKRDLAL